MADYPTVSCTAFVIPKFWNYMAALLRLQISDAAKEIILSSIRMRCGLWSELFDHLLLLLLQFLTRYSVLREKNLCYSKKKMSSWKGMVIIIITGPPNGSVLFCSLASVVCCRL